MLYKCTVLPDTPPEDEAAGDGEHVYYITAPGPAIATLLAFALDGGITSFAAEGGPDLTPEYVGTADKPVCYHELLETARSYVSVERIGDEPDEPAEDDRSDSGDVWLGADDEPPPANDSDDEDFAINSDYETGDNSGGS